MTPQPFSLELEKWLRGSQPKTVLGLSQVFGEKSFAVAIMPLMLVPALPLPTGGLTHVFEIVSMLLAAELVAGFDTIWLPRRWHSLKISDSLQEKGLPFVMRRIRWLERFAGHRAGLKLKSRPWLALTGIIIFILTLGAFVAPPFSGLDTLPSLGVVLLSLAIILEDLLVGIVGVIVGGLGVALEINLGKAVFESVYHFLRQRLG